MGVTTSDISRNECMLTGKLAHQGYDWWWHSFTARHEVTGEEKPFFIEFFLCNPELAGPEPTFGLGPDGTRGSQRPSYLMVKAGCWGEDARQMHRFFPWKDVDVTWGAPYCVQADDCLACETDLIGSVNVTAEDAAAHPEWMCDAGSMAWDLRLDKQITFNVGYGASQPLRAAQMFEMFWHAEGIKTKVSGTVVLDGQRYVVDPETSYGYADKNWGSNFTTPWVWLSSWNLVSNLTGQRLKNSVFEIGGGRPVIAGVALPGKLLGCMVYEGREFEFNFSKPWTGSKTVFDCREEDDQVVWHVMQQTRDARMITDITCPKSEMLKVNYESPDGLKRHNNLWNGGTGVGRIRLFQKVKGEWELIDDIRAANIGCEYGEYDR
ncbi:MAG: hypothetical protein Q4D06_04965 [Coriobacteriia bacterium]|nr:hypothetical protein [Coriobacteriia bacterium]